MRTVHIGSQSEFLRLTAPTSAPEEVEADLIADGLSASRTVYHGFATGFRDLADLFGRLEHDWRGWPGVRSWESVEGDLKVEARHEYGHVQLRVTLRRLGAGWGNLGWTAVADLTIEPGEQLTRIASEMRSLAAD